MSRLRGYTFVPGQSGGTIVLKFVPNGKSDGVQDCAHVATFRRHGADRLFRNSHLLAYLDAATQESRRARYYEYWSEDYPQR